MLFVVYYGPARVLVLRLMEIIVGVLFRVATMVIMKSVLKNLASLRIDLLDLLSVLILHEHSQHVPLLLLLRREHHEVLGHKVAATSEPVRAVEKLSHWVRLGRLSPVVLRLLLERCIAAIELEVHELRRLLHLPVHLRLLLRRELLLELLLELEELLHLLLLLLRR